MSEPIARTQDALRDEALAARLEQLERDVQRILSNIGTDHHSMIEPTPIRLSNAGPAGSPSLGSPEMTGSLPARSLSRTTPSSFPAARARLVRRRIRQRRERERHFPADLFADPAWDMMLDLYAAHYERREVSVSSLCIAAAVPATTALRWIKMMVDEGRFIRIADPDDGRRIHVRLSEHARAALDDYFDDMED